MIKSLLDREIGTQPSYIIRKQVIERKLESFQLSTLKGFHAEHGGPILTLALDNVQQRYLLSGGADAEIRLYDLGKNTTQLRGPRITIRSKVTIPRNAGHEFTVTGINWSPHSWKLFTTSSMDKTVKCWDSNYMVPVHTFDLKSHVYSHAMSPRVRNGLVASALGDHFIRMCDIRHKVAVLTLSGHYKSVIAVQWSPLFHNMLASAGEDGTVRIWDIRNPLRCLVSLDYTNKGSPTSARNVGHSAPVNGLTFTHDGLHLLSTGQDNTLRLWDVYQGRNVLVEYDGELVNKARLCVTLALTKSDKCIPPLVFHPTSDGRILIYDLFDGTLHDSLHGPMSSINCVIWRQHDQELYSGDGDKRILVWRSKAEEQENEDVCVEMNEQDTWSDYE